MASAESMPSRLLPDSGPAAAPAERELRAQVERVARALGRPRGRVVVSCRHARAFVPALLGAWSAGATVELLPNVGPGTLDRVDADPDIAWVLHDDVARQARSPKALHVPSLLEEPAAGEGGARAAGAAGAAGGPAATWAELEAGWPELAVQMATSGTTERPRAVTKTMAQLEAEVAVLRAVIPPAACVMSTVPLSHLYGLLFGALLPLSRGARIVSHESLLPADVAAVLEREGVDLLVSTPAHLRAMIDVAMPRGLQVLTSGAPMPTELHLRLAARHGWHVIDVLGSTETGGIATRRHPLSPWLPLPGVRVTAPEGRLVVSSAWCGAPEVELAEEVEVKDDGTFVHRGRTSELVKIAGKRAHASELEATVRTVPGVTDAAVLVHAAAGREPRVAVAIVVEPGRTVGREELAAAIRQQFDAVFVPRQVKVVPAIPRTERGKLDSEALRALFGLGAAAITERIPSRRVGPGHYLAEIPPELVFFRGHFDGFAVLPGAVIVERLVWPIVKAELPAVRALRAIRRLRFREVVTPGQTLAVHLREEPGRLSFEVRRDATVVASGQLVVE